MAARKQTAQMTTVSGNKGLPIERILCQQLPLLQRKKKFKFLKVQTFVRRHLAAGVSLYPGVHKVLNCHGMGSCGSCRVLITKGMENTSPRGLLEKARMGVSMAYIGNEETMRLACQTRVNGDITVTTCPPTNLYGENSLVDL